MKVRFNLKSKRAKTSLVLLKIHLPNQRLPFVYSTGQSVPVAFWDDKTMRAKNSRSFPQGIWLNALLDKYENLAMNCIRKSLVERGHIPSKSELREALAQGFKNKTRQQSFTEFFEAFVSKMEKDPAYSYHTTKMFRVLFRNLELFCIEKRRTLAFDEFTEEFFEQWQGWNFDQGRSKNTVAGYWRKFKVILNAAAERKLYSGDAHKRRSLSVSFQQADEVFLTVDELMKIYHLDLSGSHLETVRDIFLLDAFSGGFRFKDLASIDMANVVPLHNVKTLKIHTRKTDTAVYAPAGWYFDEFMKKYKAGWPRMKTGQVFNRQIKEICRLAGITAPVELRKNKGGQDVYIRKPKCDWVTQYTARYSFATNLYLAGVELKKISVLLGHRSVKTTETYIKAQQLDTVMSMSQNPYFSKKPTGIQ